MLALAHDLLEDRRSKIEDRSVDPPSAILHPRSSIRDPQFAGVGVSFGGPVEAGVNNTVFNENPDQPRAEQRRFNFYDYAADGQLNGSISINEFKMLGHTLLHSDLSSYDAIGPAFEGFEPINGTLPFDPEPASYLLAQTMKVSR